MWDWQTVNISHFHNSFIWLYKIVLLLDNDSNFFPHLVNNEFDFNIFCFSPFHFSPLITCTVLGLPPSKEYTVTIPQCLCICSFFSLSYSKINVTCGNASHCLELDRLFAFFLYIFKYLNFQFSCHDLFNVSEWGS